MVGGRGTRPRRHALLCVENEPPELECPWVMPLAAMVPWGGGEVYVQATLGAAESAAGDRTAPRRQPPVLRLPALRPARARPLSGFTERLSAGLLQAQGELGGRVAQRREDGLALGRRGVPNNANTSSQRVFLR